MQKACKETVLLLQGIEREQHYLAFGNQNYLQDYGEFQEVSTFRIPVGIRVWGRREELAWEDSCSFLSGLESRRKPVLCQPEYSPYTPRIAKKGIACWNFFRWFWLWKIRKEASSLAMWEARMDVCSPFSIGQLIKNGKAFSLVTKIWSNSDRRGQPANGFRVQFSRLGASTRGEGISALMF